MFRFLNAFSAYLLILIPGIALGIQANSRDEQVEKKNQGSRISAILANLETWERGDFLVSEELFFDSVKNGGPNLNGALVKESTLVRLIFDHVQKKYSVFKVKTHETICFEGDDSPEKQKQTTFYAANYSGEEKVLRYRNDRERHNLTLDKDQHDAILRSGVFPDYRTAWIKGFSFEGSDLLTLKSKLEPFELGKMLHSKFEREDSTNLSFRYEIGNDWENFPGEKFISFDFKVSNDSMLPILYEEKITVGGKETVSNEIRSSWTMLNDIYVPKSISMKKPLRLEVCGNSHAAEAEKSLLFHCFSINEKEFDDSLFDGSLLKTADSIYQMVDPVRNNATSLLPDREKIPPKKD